MLIHVCIYIYIIYRGCDVQADAMGFSQKLTVQFFSAGHVLYRHVMSSCCGLWFFFGVETHAQRPKVGTNQLVSGCLPLQRTLFNLRCQVMPELQVHLANPDSTVDNGV